MKNIKFVFIGNSETVLSVGHYPEKGSDEWLRDAQQIFEKYSQSSLKKYNQRTKVARQNENYYFTITPSNIFYLALASNNFAERDVFLLIEEIQKENIPLLIDSKTQKLNSMGKQSLKNLIEKFQPDSDKIEKIHVELKETQNVMQKNIRNVAENIDDLKGLEEKSIKIKNSSNDYKNKAVELKRLTCWQNCKWNIILGILIIGVALAIILPLAIKSGNSDSNNQNGAVSTTAPPTPPPKNLLFLI
jgi:hypothetical protein